MYHSKQNYDRVTHHPSHRGNAVHDFRFRSRSESERLEKTAVSVQQNAVTFADSIAPLLREKCSPCHFKGGKVFDRYPFDQYETVRKLGKRLNTRLKGEDADLVARWIDLGFPEGTRTQAKKP